MATDAHNAPGPHAAPAPGRRAPLLRLAFALVLTFTLLPYVWGRTLVMGMLVGRPEPPFLALTLVGVLAVALLTRGLGSTFTARRYGRWLPWGVGAAWILGNGVLVALSAQSRFPKPYLVLLFVPATLWVPWAAWMFYRPLQWRWRLAGLALGGAALAAFVSLVTVEGLWGDSQVTLAWREHGRPEPWAAAAAAPGLAVDLSTTTAHDFPEFLGPGRRGVLPDAHLARDWDAHPPRLRWKIRVGNGWGGFAVVGDFAVTQEQRGDDECIVCYRLSDGALAWIHSDRARFATSMGGPGPRATPTIAGGRVFAVGATGLLNCLHGATGRALWSVNILDDNQAENISHGVCGSPLVVDDSVVVSPTGGNGLSLAAYDRDTGRRRWQGGVHQASYSSPLLARLHGVPQILLFHSDGVTSHDPASGAILWDFPWTNGQKVNCSQPVPCADDRVLVSTAYGKGCALVRVTHSPDGAWRCETVWQNSRMKTKFTSAVIHEGFVYGLDEGILECLDLGRGRQRWKDGRYGHGQVLLAGDLLLVQAENGSVALVAPNPRGLSELGRLPALEGKTWNTPALAGPLLLVRNDHEAACYELPRRQPDPSPPTAGTSHPLKASRTRAARAR